MATQQEPIGSGFDAASTALDVLAGIDLTGFNAIVTAGHVGLGLETTRALSRAGANVVVASRDPKRAAAAVTEIDRVRVAPLDLMDPVSIARFADGFGNAPLHILINNAGIMGGRLIRDARGYESQFATNHLGHFKLTNSLLPGLRASPGARVVSVSSWGHHLSDIRWKDVHFEALYDGMAAYGQSKTANSLFAVELDKRWSSDGIRGYAVHPGGIVSTNLGPSFSKGDWRALGLIDENDQPIIDPYRDMKTPQQGAATQVFAATSPLLAEIGGVYLANSDVSPLEPDATPVTVDIANGPHQSTPWVTSYAVDPESAGRLWKLSETLTAQ